jgi:hypothetical protein
MPLGAARLAGDQFGVLGGHADRGAGDALFAADPARASWECHGVSSNSGVRRKRLRSAAAMCGGKPTARSAALVVMGLTRCGPA